MALTVGGLRAYVTTKLLTAFIVSVFPVTVIFIAGALTGAQMDAPWVWATSYALALLTAVPFACYGLAVGLWVPVQAAVGIAGASISIFASPPRTWARCQIEEVFSPIETVNFV